MTKGDCYAAAAERLAELHIKGEAKGWKLIHGIVFHEATGEHGHAWLEKGDVVFDNSNGNKVAMRKERYYALGVRKVVKSYTAEQLCPLLLTAMHYGPWSEEEEQAAKER